MAFGILVYIIYTKIFIRKNKTKSGTYLAEVENHRAKGKVVQKHLRYIGREVDGETILSSSLSDVAIDEVKVYGPVMLLDHLAKKIGLPELLRNHALEILAMVYAHCLDYKSINRVEQWFDRTDLALILPLDGVTEERLLEALDSLEEMDAMRLQQRIFERTRVVYDIPVSGILYDVTNTYLYGKWGIAHS